MYSDSAHDPPAPASGSGDGTPDGFAIILATEPTRSQGFLAELSRLVRQSHGGILITMHRPASWRGGPVVGVHLRREFDPPHTLGPGVWLGPLREEDDQRALCHWLRQGGPYAGPPPDCLRRRTLSTPRTSIMAAQTTN